MDGQSVIPTWIGVLVIAMVIGFSLARFLNYRVGNHKEIFTWKGWVGIITALLSGLGIIHVTGGFFGEYGIGIAVGYFLNHGLSFLGTFLSQRGKNALEKITLAKIYHQSLGQNLVNYIKGNK